MANSTPMGNLSILFSIGRANERMRTCGPRLYGPTTTAVLGERGWQTWREWRRNEKEGLTLLNFSTHQPLALLAARKELRGTFFTEGKGAPCRAFLTRSQLVNAPVCQPASGLRVLDASRQLSGDSSLLRPNAELQRPRPSVRPSVRPSASVWR